MPPSSEGFKRFDSRIAVCDTGVRAALWGDVTIVYIEVSASHSLRRADRAANITRVIQYY